MICKNPLLAILGGLEADPFGQDLATPAGFEPATCRLEGGCSIRLSYGVEVDGC